ncbi:MAG: exonuclease domain-containing protein [Micrococcus sp.]|nr:exonuclease domain-containing protein [Micrococcus sp.]
MRAQRRNTVSSLAGLDFTALDFETANGFRGSPCALGAVRVRDGVVVEQTAWPMRPPEGFDRFDPRNVRIHRIRPEHVAHAPRFGELFEQVRAFCGDDVLVAHNAGFDVGVIESALEVSGQAIPALDFACTLTLARRVYDLPSYALPSAAEHAGHQLLDHHDALADAQACAAILVDVARRLSETQTETAGPADGLSVAAVYAAHGLQLGHLAARAPRAGQESRATRQARGMQDAFDSRVPLRSGTALPDLMRWPDEGINPTPNPDADPANPLFGQHVVFTGALGISRQEAKNRAAAQGAQTAHRVGAATTMVVIGDGFVAEDLRAAPGTITSRAMSHRKTRDALKRRAQGQAIALVSEPEFLQMLRENWPPASA